MGEGSMGSAMSIQGIPVRLTAERWQHIRTRHAHVVAYKDRILPTVAAPEFVLEREPGEFRAVTHITPRKWLVVVYIIRGSDGYVVTAYPAPAGPWPANWKQIWP